MTSGVRNFLIIVCILIATGILTFVLDYSDYGRRNTPQIVEIPPKPDSLSQAVPDFSFTDRTGRKRSIKDFQGKTVILNFWASWCSPCVKEFPLLLKAAQLYPDRVILLALSSDFTEDAMEQFLTEKVPDAISMNNVVVALDPNASITADIFQTIRLPETIIINAEGYMTRKLVGANWDLADMQDALDLPAPPADP